jgi:hypothetical protein
MTTEQYTELAREWIERYLTADAGDWLTVYSDGTAQILDASSTAPEGSVAWVRCPGIGNLDGTRYTEGATDPTDLLASIREACETGDVSDEIDGLADALARDEEWQLRRMGV